MSNDPEVSGLPTELINHCASMRKGVGEQCDKATELKKLVQVAALPEGIDRGEAIANVVLAYRHLEDARMRFGKAIQALEGGKSCYDR